jgi:hypothetical protein
LPARETRWICLFVAVILVAAVALLWIPPGRTADLWAWTIKPDMTPLFMGSAYGAGVYFFARGFGTTRWHRIAAGFPGIAVFAALMLAATVIHWDRFNHGDAPLVASAAFYGWTVVYAIAPFLVGWAWVRNLGVDPGKPETVDTVVPLPLRGLAAAGGAAAAALGILLFAKPSVGVEHWPWELTPLTTRVIACFVIEAALIALFLARDSRWSAWRVLTQTAVAGAVLLLIGVARAWEDWDRGALTWLFVGALAATPPGAVAVHVVMDRRARQSAAAGGVAAAGPAPAG